MRVVRVCLRCGVVAVAVGHPTAGGRPGILPPLRLTVRAESGRAAAPCSDTPLMMHLQ